MSTTYNLDQFKETYIAECYELLDEMESCLMGLDEDAPDIETLHAVFRCAHSIKGGGGAFGFTEVVSFTHVLEALLEEMRSERVSPTREIIDALLESADAVRSMVDAIQCGETIDMTDASALQARLVAFSDGAVEQPSDASEKPSDTPDDKTDRQYNIKFVPNPGILQTGNDPILIIRELQRLGELDINTDTSKIPAVEDIIPQDAYLSWHFTLSGQVDLDDVKEVFEFVEDECDLEITSIEDKADEANETAPLQEQPQQTDQPKSGNAKASPAAQSGVVKSIRVDIDKIDRLINMVGEVVITQAFLSAQISQLDSNNHTELVRGVDEMMHYTRELQEAVMAIRMQPVKSIFSRMPRLVRDLSNQLNKQVTLVTRGEDTEVDKTIIEQLSDPLTHMIRNSVDHGVEMPDERTAKGKPAEGTIVLSAEHRGGRIVIEIADDGNGINREKVFQKAVEKGVISSDAVLSDKEIDMLIFAAGFSTAETVSNVSGRGVGMDVVRRNIEGIGGLVLVENRPGEGSTFSISLPLTLAILDGMIIRCGQEYYIIPINNIIETLRPKPSEVKSIADGSSVINVRGEFIPVVYLYQAFFIHGATKDASKGLVVLVENGNDIFGVVVDELVGQQQVVIKSLEENSDPVEGISGATILGDGKVSLILDIGKLSRMRHQTELPPDGPSPDDNDIIVNAQSDTCTEAVESAA